MSESDREGRSDLEDWPRFRADFLRLLSNFPRGQETQEEYEKWVCEPIITYPLSPRQAKAALELLGYLSSYGINIDHVLLDLAKKWTKEIDPQYRKKSKLKSKIRRKIR